MQAIPFFVGTYTKPADHVKEACGLGILSCMLDRESGRIRQTYVRGNILNPTYLTHDREKQRLYAASENCEGLSKVYAFAVGENYRLSKISEADTKGEATCHVNHWQDQLFAASYGSGNLAVFQTGGGRLVRSAALSYKGSGPNRARQEAAHAHQAIVSPDNKWLYVCDLGADCIWKHSLETGSPGKPFGIAVPPGSGPRHLVFHPGLPFVYVLSELTADLLIYQYSGATGGLTLIQQVNTLPENYNGMPSAAAIRIHPAGRMLYVSNRQCNTICALTLSGDGRVEVAGQWPSGGREPRDFQIDPSGTMLLVANQDENNICVYELDVQTGLPQDSILHTFSCNTPVCIEF